MQVTHDKSTAQVGFKDTRTFSALDPHAGFGSSAVSCSSSSSGCRAPPLDSRKPASTTTGPGWRSTPTTGCCTGGIAEPGRQDDQLPDERMGRVQGPLPVPRSPCRGQPGSAVARVIDGSKVNLHLPDQLGQALDPDGARQLPHLSPHPGLPPGRDVLLELLHRRLRDPRLQPCARLPRQPRLHAPPIPDAVPAFNWLHMGDAVDVYYYRVCSAAVSGAPRRSSTAPDIRARPRTRAARRTSALRGTPRRCRSGRSS